MAALSSLAWRRKPEGVQKGGEAHVEDIIVKKKAFPKVKSVASITEPQIEKLDIIIHYFRIIGKRNFVSDADKLYPEMKESL